MYLFIASITVSASALCFRILRYDIITGFGRLPITPLQNLNPCFWRMSVCTGLSRDIFSLFYMEPEVLSWLRRLNFGEEKTLARGEVFRVESEGLRSRRYYVL